MELHQLRPARDLTLADVIERSAYYSQLRRRAAERTAMPRPSVAIGGVSALALLAAATAPKLLGGGAAGSAHRAAALTEAAVTGVVPAQTPRVEPAPRLATKHPATTARRAAHSAAIRAVPAGTSSTAAPTGAPQATSGASQPAPSTPHVTTATPRATIASVNTHTVRHASGGAALTAAPRHTTVKPRSVHRPPAVHRAPSRHVRRSTTTSHTSGGVAVRSKTTSQATAAPVSSGAYVNPLADAHLTPERIDQGVDYSGSGTLTALGAGRVNYVATSGTGWPGAFIEYRLTGGPDAGRYVYYAEGVSPLVRVGQSLRPGQAVARLITGWSSGIEIGWGSGLGTQPLAQAEGQPKSESIATAAGRSFSALIASLGGLPGKIEG